MKKKTGVIIFAPEKVTPGINQIHRALGSLAKSSVRNPGITFDFVPTGSCQIFGLFLFQK